MPLLQWVVLWAIGLVPALTFPFLSLWKTVGPFDLPYRCLVYLLWVILVFILVPKAFREEKSKAEQSFDSKLQGPIEDVQRIGGELGQAKADIQVQRLHLAETDRTIQDMKDDLAKVGISLPSHHRVSAEGVAFTFSVSQPAVTHRAHAGRLVRWVKRPALRFLGWFRGLIWGRPVPP